eukprot:gene10149-20421_t
MVPDPPGWPSVDDDDYSSEAVHRARGDADVLANFRALLWLELGFAVFPAVLALIYFPNSPSVEPDGDGVSKREVGIDKVVDAHNQQRQREEGEEGEEGEAGPPLPLREALR